MVAWSNSWWHRSIAPLILALTHVLPEPPHQRLYVLKVFFISSGTKPTLSLFNNCSQNFLSSLALSAAVSPSLSGTLYITMLLRLLSLSCSSSTNSFVLSRDSCNCWIWIVLSPKTKLFADGFVYFSSNNWFHFSLIYWLQWVFNILRVLGERLIHLSFKGL